MKKIICGLLLLASHSSFSQILVPWTEDNGTLGLGYPVPIPVNTPEPFDGFRSYDGLFAKHQSMALNNPYISGQVVGATHYDRDIWAYILSDQDNRTKYGVKEGAMLVNGGIHAREWQSPEVLTGIMETLNENAQDQSLHQYLLENTTIIAVPVNNVDGFLQTQRYPAQNWLIQGLPRDGRMRRKNMLNVDEDLMTFADHSLGVDLNRNNAPYWSTSNSSSADVGSIVHHGAFVHSEPETQARLNAAELIDRDQLRVYTDVHSYTTVHFSVRTDNGNTNILQSRLLQDFTTHHRAFPAAKNYIEQPDMEGRGIGTTTEYFATEYEIPSWTLEVEPSAAGGGEYGGFRINSHDGFILPESEVRRVREQLAETFMVTWYGQAGPPSVTSFVVVDKNTRAVIYDANWDIQSDEARTLYSNQVDKLLSGGEYSLIVGFDKPMRMRNDDNEVVHLQGQITNPVIFPLNPVITASFDGADVELNMTNGRWLNEKTADAFSYQYYKDDTFTIDFTVPENLKITENAQLSWSINVEDMIRQKLDADPSTVVTWADGTWKNYENNSGLASISGGIDRSYSTELGQSSSHDFAPLVQATGLYFDPDRNGEGFSYELLDNNNVWLQWFTYDAQGQQRWLSGLGQYMGNVITVDNLTQANGGIFGADFDANNIVFEEFGSIRIIFSGGDLREPAIGIHEVDRTAQVLFTDTDGKKLRTNLQRLSYVKGAINDDIVNSDEQVNEPDGLITGSWYDPMRSGEGYIIEILTDGRAVLVWYTYDVNGQLMWLLDSDGVISQSGNEITLIFDNVVTTNGGMFGEDFDPEDVNIVPWGTVHMQLNCAGHGVINYESPDENFGIGQYDITRLTSPLLLDFVCDQ